MTTIYDIAVEARVSTATVSRVLNNPELVAEKTRLKVQSAIERLHYAPNALARELVTKNTNLIGLLIPDIANSFSPAIVDSVMAELEKNGYHIFLSITDADPEKELSCIDLMLKKRVEGIILLGARLLGAPSNARIAALAQQGNPVVVVDYFDDEDAVCCVRCDEQAGAALAVEHLLGLGHRSIALVNGQEELTTYHYKRLGYESALAGAGLAPRGDFCVNVPSYFEGGYEAAQQLLDLPDPPTALFVGGEQMGVGVYRAIASRGLRVGEDVSVIGFSGSPLSQAVYPALSTISQRAREMGALAAQKMLSLIAGEEAKSEVLAPVLLRRDSCRRP